MEKGLSIHIESATGLGWCRVAWLFCCWRVWFCRWLVRFCGEGPLQIRFDGGVQADRAMLFWQLIDQLLPCLLSLLARDRDVQVVSTDCDRHGLKCPPLIWANVWEGVVKQVAACQQLLWARNRLRQQQFKGETLPCCVAGIGGWQRQSHGLPEVRASAACGR
ncbi:hypothetical protein [Parasynechococcus sp.]|uniref:hypothetical protein n=1 Tax=Parasynechococcus sp. TaxID=3101203 RepID=UPI003703EB98